MVRYFPCRFETLNPQQRRNADTSTEQQTQLQPKPFKHQTQADDFRIMTMKENMRWKSKVSMMFEHQQRIWNTRTRIHSGEGMLRDREKFDGEKRFSGRTQTQSLMKAPKIGVA